MSARVNYALMSDLPPPISPAFFLSPKCTVNRSMTVAERGPNNKLNEDLWMAILNQEENVMIEGIYNQANWRFYESQGGTVTAIKF